MSAPSDVDGSESTGERAADRDAAEHLVDVAVLVAHSPQVAVDDLADFAGRMVDDAATELQSATGTPWRFTAEEPAQLSDTSPRRPSQFLDEAMDRTVDGPYDLIVVVTDAPLVSRRQRFVPGLASPVSRVVVVSTRKLTAAPCDRTVRSLDSEPVRWNAATLLLHLLGHVLGTGHTRDPDDVMSAFEFDPSRRSTPAFDVDVEQYLHRIARRIPETDVSRGPLRRFGFHVVSALRNPRQVLDALAHSRAPTLPLSLPKLATAAITPTLVIIFSAESWDVGVHLSNATAAFFVVASILAAAVHLVLVQNLWFPRRNGEHLTEHMALVNVTVFLILVTAMVGLFALVASVMLVIEFFVFPPQLMSNWPTLEEPTIDLIDRVRTAAFISTLGMLSGALAGGLENRELLRHLALFRRAP
ncbi:hypothetical protein VB773_08070 [Haloarculaceae archaeon H-GB2-1]|nr:hypothetical protein [Haloarculaceae archaeon H-GB1-1]MEA5407524.1 hypothetical protein [Haloarculaceae archaeon H-GB2-1]